MNGPWHYKEGERLLYALTALDDEDPAVWPIALRAQAHMAAALAAGHAEATWARNQASAGHAWRDVLEHNPMVCQVPLPDAAGICGNDVEPGASDCGGHRTDVIRIEGETMEPATLALMRTDRTTAETAKEFGVGTSCPTCSGRWTCSRQLTVLGQPIMCADRWHVDAYPVAVPLPAAPAPLDVPPAWLDDATGKSYVHALARDDEPMATTATNDVREGPYGGGWRDEATGLISGGLVTDDEPGGSR